MLFESLSELLVSKRSDSWLITDSGIEFSQFKADVIAAKKTIETLGPGDTAIFTQDTYKFLVWLFATWQADRMALIPSVNGKEIDQQIPSSFIKIGDLPHADILIWNEESNQPNEGFKTLKRAKVGLSVFTSGTTGKPVKITKTIAQLENEILALENKFGVSIDHEAVFTGSASHQHFFGLPFRVLWAICRGSRFSSQLVQNPFDWRVSDQQVFITSPAFLKRVALASKANHIDTQQSGVLAIFSAGGVLDHHTARSTALVTGVFPYEIYGSSEAGHIAWRQGEEMSWQIQDGIKIRQNELGILEIQSNFLPDAAWLVTSDRVNMLDDSFELLGRSDKIIKIEDKRVSVTSIEDGIYATGWVKSVKVLDLGLGLRHQLAAVLVLNSDGINLIKSEGKTSLVNSIRGFLRHKIDAVAIPRRWRFIHKLPENDFGKVVKNDLEQLFQPDRLIPIIVHSEVSESSASFILDISHDLAALDGHFPRFPVVPGVAQIEWAIYFSRNTFNILSEFKGMDQIKFLNLLQPPCLVELSLSLDLVKKTVSFKYFSGTKLVSSGRIK
jgi:acyl-coenzyme A synthetase/AMP-(fatty) acid ligase/3-hydroxymyristoyl/3-hydroxydecanoyl-(acyl carrier protein) dehydratase